MQIEMARFSVSGATQVERDGYDAGRIRLTSRNIRQTRLAKQLRRRVSPRPRGKGGTGEL